MSSTTGRREGGRHCDPTYVWALDKDVTEFERYFRMGFYATCKFTKLLFWLVTFSIPEMILYPITFKYILEHTNRTASAGILRPEVIKNRKQQNSLNIYMTCLACVAQLVTNTIFVILMKLFFGKFKFYHSLFAVITVSFNFNLMPFFYIIVADEEFKRAIANKQYVNILKLFFEF